MSGSSPRPPLLSVCIPTYDRPARAASLAIDILGWGANVEVIVADDAPTADLGAGLPAEVRYLWDGTRHGQYANTNRAIAAATGEWAVALNDDDALLPSIVEILEAAPMTSVLVSGTTRWSGAGAGDMHQRHTAKLRTLRLPGVLGGKGAVRDFLVYGNPFVCSHTTFRRSVAIRIGGFDPELRHVGDFDLWLRIAGYGEVVMSDVVVGDYRLHDENHSLSVRGGLDLAAEQPLVVARTLKREGRNVPRSIRIAAVKALAKALLARHRAAWTVKNVGPLLVGRVAERNSASLRDTRGSRACD